MVLRGSKIKPEVGYVEAQSEVQKALRDLHEIEDRNLEERQKIWERLGQIEEDKDSNLSRDEILQLLHALHTRVVQLENEKMRAELNVAKKFKVFQDAFKQFAAGGLAGCTARTFVAPIDRTKILLQTQFVNNALGSKTKYTGIIQTFQKIVSEEGVHNLWRGNVVNCIRVAPYAATQFTSYAQYKRMLSKPDEDFTVLRRLLCGGLAGATATTITHPLDVVRLRIATTPDINGIAECVKRVYAENGLRTFYKGYAPTLLSLSPFIAVNFASFDFLKSWYYPDGEPKEISAPITLSLGALAGLTAQTFCFPLDTVRRRMQMEGTAYKSTFDAFRTILRVEGARGFYKGMLPNAVKIVPNNGIRFLAFDFFTRIFGVEKRKRGK
eukprot:g157.t1